MQTDTPGRPKKQYHIANVALTNLEDDPETIEDILERPDL